MTLIVEFNFGESEATLPLVFISVCSWYSLNCLMGFSNKTSDCIHLRQKSRSSDPCGVTRIFTPSPFFSPWLCRRFHVFSNFLHSHAMNSGGRLEDLSLSVYNPQFTLQYLPYKGKSNSLLKPANSILNEVTLSKCLIPCVRNTVRKSNSLFGIEDHCWHWNKGNFFSSMAIETCCLSILFYFAFLSLFNNNLIVIDMR